MAERGNRKTRVGRVTSDKADKTITVAVETIVSHPLYKKTLKRTKKLMADDQQNQAQHGDLVEIMETRPLSKLKNWRLTKIIEKAK
jgi:small subunit ribosomal protein S17